MAKRTKRIPFKARPIETWAPQTRARVLAKVAPGSSSVGVHRDTKPCSTRKPGGSEVVFLPAADASASGAVPGATVRLCTGAKRPGYLVSVRSSEEATRVAKAWKTCMAGGGADEKACVEGGWSSGCELGSPSARNGSPRRSGGEISATADSSAVAES